MEGGPARKALYSTNELPPRGEARSRQGHRVRHAHRTGAGRMRRLEHVRVRDVASLRFVGRLGCQLEATTAASVEDRAKDTWRVEIRQAEPVDRSIVFRLERPCDRRRLRRSRGGVDRYRAALAARTRVLSRLHFSEVSRWPCAETRAGPATTPPVRAPRGPSSVFASHCSRHLCVRRSTCLTHGARDRSS